MREPASPGWAENSTYAFFYTKENLKLLILSLICGAYRRRFWLMYKIKLAILFSCIHLFAIAGEVNSALVIWTKDGNKVVYSLAEKPKITFSDKEMLLMTSVINVSFPLSNLKRFTFQNSDEVAIVNIINDEPIINMDKDQLIFQSLKENSIVGIYGLNGIEILKKTIHKTENYSFYIGNLSNGVYIVSVNGLNYKLIKK